MPTPIVAGNWKMHTTLEEARSLAQGVRRQVAGVSGVEVVLCPPFPYLLACRDILEGSGIRLGAQNMHFEEKGAFTGEVAPPCSPNSASSSSSATRSGGSTSARRTQPSPARCRPPWLRASRRSCAWARP